MMLLRASSFVRQHLQLGRPLRHVPIASLVIPTTLVIAAYLAAGCATAPVGATSQVVVVPPPLPRPWPAGLPLVVATDPPPTSDDEAGLDGDVAQEPCGTAAKWRSELSEVSLHLDFQNDTHRTLSMVWLDFQGKRVHYADLAPGEGYRQQTFVTHPWMAVDADGQCRGLFVPLASGNHRVTMRAR